MKIAYIVSQFPILTETFVAREMSELIRLGNQVTICILRPIPQTEGPQGLKIREAQKLRVSLNIMSLLLAQFRALIIFPNKYISLLKEIIIFGVQKPKRVLNLIYLFVSSTWFAFELKDQNIQYIHAHFLHSESIVARWLSILLKLPYGITSHVSSVRFSQELINKVVNNANLLVGDTCQTLDGFYNLFGCDKAHLIRNGINLDLFPFSNKSNSPNDKNKPIILAIGSLVFPKGFHVLIKACAILREKGIDFNCRIIGEGSERGNLSSLITKFGLGGSVALPGDLPFDALRDQYKDASIFVMPSVPSLAGSDGLPTVLIEAMALGVPVVATNHAGIPDLVQNKKTGLLVDPGNSEALAECIAELLEDKELSSQMVDNGRKLIELEYNLKANVAKLANLMQKYM